jgi:hypothetical protein
MTDKVEHREDSETPRGPAGDALPGREKADPRTGGGQSQEEVADRPNVGAASPDDYPERDRKDATPG